MKKVLSLVLAAAMVMGMSVSAFAADFSKPAGSAAAQDAIFEWGTVYQVRNGEKFAETEKDGSDIVDITELKLKSGDKLYFEINETADVVTDAIPHDHKEACAEKAVMFALEDVVKGELEQFVIKALLEWDGDVTVAEFMEALNEMPANIKNAVVENVDEEAINDVIEAAMGLAGELPVEFAILSYIPDEVWAKIGTALDAVVDAKIEAALVDLFCDEEGTAGSYKSGAAMYKAPKNWTLKIENSEYIDDAEVVNLTGYQAEDLGFGTKGQLFVVVTLNNEFDSYEAAEEDEVLEFFMYIYADAFKNAAGETVKAHRSEKVTVHYGFKAYDEVLVQNTDTMTVSKSEFRKYGENVVDSRYVINAKANARYTLDSEFKTAQTVVFEIADDVLVTVKMWPGESYLVKGSVDSKYEKALSKEYDSDIRVVTFNTTCDVREVLWESAKDNKQLVEVVDGYLVAVDSEFVTKYEVIDNYRLAKGYVADVDANEGVYALIDADLELIAAPEVEVEADKANPSTGASDFVGAAVAMAVVSVAAAGALALKK